MSELRAMHGSSTLRIPVAAAFSLAAFVGLFSDASAVYAGWWSFPKSHKSTEEAPPKPNSGFSNTVRKLVKDAKTQEEQGNLDKAIALADRAAKVSEATSAFNKDAPDVSPAVTSKYAHDLRLKKAEQSVRRPTPAIVAEKSQTTENLKTSPKTAAANTRVATSKAPEFTRQHEPRAEQTQVVKVARSKQPAAASDVDSTRVVKANNTRLVETRTESVSEKTLVQTTSVRTDKPEASIEKDSQVAAVIDHSWESEAPFEQDDPRQAQSDRDEALPDESAHGNVAGNNEGSWWLDGIPDPKAVAESATSSLQTSEAIEAADGDVISPAPLRLRPQYAGILLQDGVDIAESSVNLAVAKSEEAQSDNEPTDHEQSMEFDKVVPTSAREESLSERPHKNATPSSPSKEEVRMLTYDDVPFAESIEELQELRRRLQTASSFEPGAVAPGAMTDWQQDSSADSTNGHTAKTSILRLRKRRQTIPTISAPLSVSPPISPRSKQSVIEHTSIVQWRPARTESLPDPKINRPRSQNTASIQEDIRQALPRDRSVATQGTRSTLRQPDRLQSNAWIDSKSSTVASNSVGAAGSSPMIAPLPPPTDPIEWTSFNQSKDPLKPPLDSNPDHEWMSSATAFTSADDPGQLLRKAQGDASETRGSTSDQDQPNRGTIERVAAALHMSTSTVWTAISAAAFSMLLAGLWTIRAAVRSNFAKNDQ